MNRQGYVRGSVLRLMHVVITGGIVDNITGTFWNDEERSDNEYNQAIDDGEWVEHDESRVVDG